MQIDMFNLDDFILVNKLKQVSNPISLTSARMPSSDGIFSYDIFGYTTEERKNTFAYIDLHGIFFHPQCIKTLNRMGFLGKIAAGIKYATVVAGKINIVEKGEDPAAKTGVDFFYNNWEKINWTETGVLFKDAEKDAEADPTTISFDKKKRIKFFDLLKKHKDQAFVTKWLVLPPYFRDMNTDNETLGEDINKVYNELISKTNSLKTSFGFSSFGAVARNRVQDLLTMLYDISLGPVTGKSVDITQPLYSKDYLLGNSKNSILKKNLIGRFIDFSGYSVISAPVASDKETVNTFAKFGKIKFPISLFAAMAKPFFIHYFDNFFTTLITAVKTNLGFDIKTLDANQWSITEIDKCITRFIKSPSEKDMPIYIKYINNDDEQLFCVINIVENKTGKDNDTQSFIRPLTYLDLFYMAGHEIAKDKYSLNTRHPVTNNQNIYPAKAEVSSTIKTKSVYIKIMPMFNTNLGTALFDMHMNKTDSDFIYFDDYPYINAKESISILKNIDPANKDMENYINNIYKKHADPDPLSISEYSLYRTVIIGNGVIEMLGADYDGDMMFFRLLFTKEANAAAEKIIWKKSNWFLADGGLSRGLSQIKKDCALTLYELTKD